MDVFELESARSSATIENPPEPIIAALMADRNEIRNAIIEAVAWSKALRARIEAFPDRVADTVRTITLYPGSAYVQDTRFPSRIPGAVMALPHTNRSLGVRPFRPYTPTPYQSLPTEIPTKIPVRSVGLL